MSDSTWNEGLTAAGRKAVQGKFASANKHVLAGEASLLRAGRELRIALRTYLKGDKQRFIAAAAELFDRGPSSAYEYVQAADAAEKFTPAVKAAGTDPQTLGVRTWAKLDRFAGSPDDIAEGMKVIATEAKAAKKEGRKAFSNEGLKESIRTVQGEPKESTGTDDERKVGRIAGKYRDEFRDEFRRFAAVLQEKGERTAYLYAMQKGAAWGAASGALTPTALVSLTQAWNAEDRMAQLEAEKVQAAAEKLLAEREAAKALKPEPKAEPKPEASVKEQKPKPAAPKRSGGKAAPKGVAALTANAQ